MAKSYKTIFDNLNERVTSGRIRVVRYGNVSGAPDEQRIENGIRKCTVIYHNEWQEL